MSNDGDEELRVRIVADDEGASATIDGVARGIQKIKASSGDMGRGLGDAASSAKDAGAALGGASAAAKTAAESIAKVAPVAGHADSALGRAAAAVRSFAQDMFAAAGGVTASAGKTGGTAPEINKFEGAIAGAAKRIAALYGVWQAYDMAKEATLLAARYETLGVSMNIVGNNAGYTSSQMESAAESLQKTGISMIESRQQVMRLAQANIDLSNASKLARIAQDAAVIGNMNSSQAFATMIHGIQTGQTDVLRTIGINVSLEQTYAQYAKTLGITANALTAQQKMQATANAVMQEGEKISGTYVAAMDTAAKKLNSLARYHENLKVIMGETFTQSLAAAVDVYTGGIKGLNEEASSLSEQNKLREFGRGVAITFAVAADGTRILWNALVSLGSTLAWVETGIESVAVVAYKVMSGRFAEVAETVDGYADRLRKLNESNRAALEGMADTSRVTRAVTGMFDDMDKRASESAERRVKAEEWYVRGARKIAAEFAHETAEQQTKRMQALADSIGGDVKAQYGTQATAPTADVGAGDAKSDREIAEARRKYALMREMASEHDATEVERIENKKRRDLAAMDAEFAKLGESGAKNAALVSEYAAAKVAIEEQAAEKIRELRQKDVEAEVSRVRALQQAIEMQGASKREQIDLKLKYDIEAANEEYQRKVAQHGYNEDLERAHLERLELMRKDAKFRSNAEDAKEIQAMRAMFQFKQSLRAADFTNAMSMLAAATAGAAQHNRKAFEINKAASIAGILVKAPKIITDAFDSGQQEWGSYWGGVAYAAAASAAVYAQLSAAQSATFGGGGGAAPAVGGTAGVPASVAAQNSGYAPSGESGYAASSQPRLESERRVVNIHLDGNVKILDARMVRDELIPLINDAVGDGVLINVN